MRAFSLGLSFLALSAVGCYTYAPAFVPDVRRRRGPTPTKQKWARMSHPPLALWPMRPQESVEMLSRKYDDYVRWTLAEREFRLREREIELRELALEREPQPQSGDRTNPIETNPPGRSPIHRRDKRNFRRHSGTVRTKSARGRRAG